MARDAIVGLDPRLMDSRAFRAAVLDRLRKAIGFDWYAWVLTDPETTVGVDPLADVPDLAELPRLIRLKYLTPVNRWTGLAPVAALGDRASDSRLWREVQSRHEVRDVASVVFGDAFGCWGFLDLWTSGRYDDDDLGLLADVAPVITRGLRLHQARNFDFPAMGEQPPSGPVVLLLDDHSGVIGQTTNAETWLDVLLPHPDGSDPIPACAYNVAGQLAAVEQGVDDHQPVARVHLANGVWVTLQASRMAPTDTIAVTIEPSTIVDRLDLFSRTHGLSKREHQLLTHLAQGLDTRDAAARMCLSPHTIQDHLKSIFVKTDLHSRRVVLSRALGVPVAVTS